MFTQNIKATREQSGMSLIGLMIGMLLSIVSVLAAMSMYHSLVDAAIDTKIDASHDAQLASAMLTIQLELQGAGAYIDDLDNDDSLMLIGGALYWRHRTDNTGDVDNVKCKRLKYADNKLTLNTLVYPDCKITTAIEGRDYDTAQAALSVQVLADFVAEAPTITLSLNQEKACWPYGHAQNIAADHLHREVTIEAQSAASRATGGTNDSAADTANSRVTMSVYNFCIANMPPYTPPVI